MRGEKKVDRSRNRTLDPSHAVRCLCPRGHGDYTCYTEDAGLQYFDRAAVIANGNWYYTSALESMGAKLCFHYCLVNIGPSYK